MENMKNAQDVVGMPATEPGCEMIETQMKKLLGKRLVTSDGTLVGTVIDFSFSTGNGELIHLYLILQNTWEYLELPVTLVDDFGDDTIVVSGNYLDHSIKIYFMKREQLSHVKVKKLLKNS